jgi:hypothetical protein
VVRRPDPSDYGGVCDFARPPVDGELVVDALGGKACTA